MLPAYDNNLSGEIYPTTGEILLQNSRQLPDVVYNRLHVGMMEGSVVAVVPRHQRLEYKGEFASGQKQHTGQLSWQMKF